MLQRNTQILLGVFALLLIVFFALRNLPQADPEEAVDLPTQAVVSNLFDFEPAAVTGVRIENLDGKTVEVRREGEVWLMVQPPAPAEETDITRIESLVSAIGALRLLTEADLEASLSVVGLDFPPFLLTFTLDDGTVHEVAIGEPSVTGTGYYVSLDGGPTRLATRSVLDQFIGLLDMPPYLPTPVPTPEIIDPAATVEP